MFAGFTSVTAFNICKCQHWYHPVDEVNPVIANIGVNSGRRNSQFHWLLLGLSLLTMCHMCQCCLFCQKSVIFISFFIALYAVYNFILFNCCKGSKWCESCQCYQWLIACTGASVVDSATIASSLNYYTVATAYFRTVTTVFSIPSLYSMSSLPSTL